MTAKEAIQKYGSMNKAAKALCCGKPKISESLRTGKDIVLTTRNVPQDPVVSKASRGISKSEFLSKYDEVEKCKVAMRQAVAMMEHGRIYTDFQQRQDAGCNDKQVWRQVAEDHSNGFTANQFRTTDGQVWWSDRTTVAETIKTCRKAKPLGGAV